MGKKGYLQGRESESKRTSARSQGKKRSKDGAGTDVPLESVGPETEEVVSNERGSEKVELNNSVKGLN